MIHIDAKINSLRNLESQYAAFGHRLEFEVDYITGTIVNNEQTLSKIVDADMAVQTSQLMKYKFLEDAAISMYVQTKDQKGSIMKLYFDQSKVEGQGKMFL